MPELALPCIQIVPSECYYIESNEIINQLFFAFSFILVTAFLFFNECDLIWRSGLWCDQVKMASLKWTSTQYMSALIFLKIILSYRGIAVQGR